MSPERQDFQEPLACDTYRKTGGYSRYDTWRLAWRDRNFRPVATLRWYRSAGWLGRKFAAKAHALACHLAGIDLPEIVDVGEGFLILHGWGIVINARARIGRNVTLLHGVTIGSGASFDEGGARTIGYPVLEDGVTVGPNAAIVGGITVGEGARILPGAVVYFDVPAHALVGGNPGRIIKQNVPEDIWHKVPFP